MENISDIFNIDPNAQTKAYRKGALLQSAGDSKSLTFYVKAGLLRSYIIDSKGKEHIFMFAPEGWIIADVESLEYGKPVELYIDCLEDSEVVILEKELLFNAEVSKEMIIKNANLLYRRMGVLQRRVLMLMSAPAVDRYEYFLEAYPNLAYRVPQRMIATYLGVTPQVLSTIRAKMAHS